MHSDNRHEYKSFACGRCGDTFHAPLSCGDRFCSVCTGPRRRKVQAKLDAIVASLKMRKRYSIKFLTLTIPNQEDSRAAFKIIQKSFRRLRQRSFWKWKVDGGAWVVEITGRPGRWHVHIHAVLEAQFIRHSLLKRHWSQVSPGNIVYIQAIPVSAVISYLTKYVAKSEVGSEHRVQISRALKGCRLFQPFGSWQALALEVSKVKYVCPECGYAHFVLQPANLQAERLSSRSSPAVWQQHMRGTRFTPD